MYDVIVIGAGPAGNIAAIRLSKMGHRVVVLDRRENLGDKLCTGIVGRECVERFPPDDVDIYQGARSAIVIAPSGKRHRIVKDEPQAYIINRVAFVASLAKRASEAGAIYRLGEKVSEVTCDNRSVNVRTTLKSGAMCYEARVVIIASGFASPLLRQVGLDNGINTDHMVGCQAEVETCGLEETEVYLGDAIAPGSFGWMVPLIGSRALVGLVSRHKLNGHMRDFMSDLELNGKIKSVIKKPARWGIPIKPIPKTYGNRVIVTGDAAGLVKPTTGGGIYYALVSGEMAVDTVQEAFETGEFSARGLRQYESRWKVTFGNELRVGYYARRLYEALGDRQIDCLLEEFLSTQTHLEFMHSSEFSFDWHSKLILKAIGHRQLGRTFASFGPMVAPFLARLVGLKAG